MDSMAIWDLAKTPTRPPNGVFDPARSKRQLVDNGACKCGGAAVGPDARPMPVAVRNRYMWRIGRFDSSLGKERCRELTGHTSFFLLFIFGVATCA